MSHRSLITAILLFLASAIGYTAGRAQERPANAKAPNPLSGATFEEQVSYAIGLEIGRGMLADNLKLNPDLVAKGLADALKKSPPLLTDDQCTELMTKFTTVQQNKAAEEAKTAGDKNLTDGQAFLAANKAKPGVTTTETGLQYQVLKGGNGASPKATDTVRVHYHGTLIDGTVFDSSVQRDTPAEFPVNRVIPGWTQALQKMKVGDKWRLTIPSELAYGPRGTPGGPIPPNSVLVFDVELLDIVK